MKKLSTLIIALAAFASFTQVKAAKHTYCTLYQGTLTFYFDDNRNSRPGTSFTVSAYEDMGWHDVRESIKTVNFDSSFAGFTNPAPARWFEECTNLTTVLNAQNLNTTYTTSAYGMFYHCSKLKSVDVSTWFTTGYIQNLGAMFCGCKELESLDVSNWNTLRVTNMTAMFDNCESLKTLDVSKWNTANVTNMSLLFYGCTALETLDVSKWNTANVTDMSQMFYNCKNLKFLGVSLWNTANVTDMCEMFCSCQYLKTLEVRKWKTGKVTNMRGMFYHCSSLNYLEPEDWDVSNVTDMSIMFAVTKIDYLDLHKWNTQKVTKMNSMFAEGVWLYLDLGGWNTTNVTEMSYMFDHCKKLKTIWCDNAFKNFNVTNEHMFASCEQLQGEKGTAYNSNYIDGTYAHPDGGTGNPGYFCRRTIPVDAAHFPDYAFRGELESLFGSEISVDELRTHGTTLELINTNQIKDLTGIEYLRGFVEELIVRGNELTTMNLKQNTALQWIYCEANQINGAGMDNLVSNLPIVTNGKFYVYDDSSSGYLGDLNEMTPQQVSVANSRGWTVYVYDEHEGKYSETKGFWQFTEERFPNQAFREYLRECDFRCPRVLTLEDEIEEIEPSGLGIDDFTGIEYLTSLTGFYFGNNNVERVDLSKNVNLSLIYCEKNRLSGNNMDIFIMHLPTVEDGRILVYYGSDKENPDFNEMIPAQVKAANKRGWKVQVYNDNEKRWVETKGYWLLNEINFPDPEFRKYIEWYFDGPACRGALTYEETVEAEELTSQPRGLTDLKGIERFQNVEVIEFPGNKLTHVDLSGNIKAEYVDLSMNQIKGTDMDDLIASLRTMPQGETGSLCILCENHPEYAEGNQITPEQVAAARAKGWIPQEWDAVKYEYTECPGYYYDPDGVKAGTVQSPDDSKLYDLQGREVKGQPAKGIYIVGGKKVYR